MESTQPSAHRTPPCSSTPWSSLDLCVGKQWRGSNQEHLDSLGRWNGLALLSKHALGSLPPWPGSLSAVAEHPLSLSDSLSTPALHEPSPSWGLLKHAIHGKDGTNRALGCTPSCVLPFCLLVLNKSGCFLRFILILLVKAYHMM